jgi:hypothetical protein
VQESVDRLVSVGDARTALRKRTTPANDQWSHPLGHTLGISPDEADLVEKRARLITLGAWIIWNHQNRCL